MRIAARYLAAVTLAGGLGVALMWTTVAATRSNPILRIASAAQPGGPRGQTTTRLADGRWLVIGGAINGEPMATATIIDTRAGEGSRVVPLSVPRAWHTATVLPDGTVLIAGGLGRGAQVLGAPEIFDPTTETFAPIAVAGSAARSGHTATLLTDGRVLVAGGTAADGAAAVPELWTLDAGNGTAQGLPAIGARQGHAATLIADGRVLLVGGQDADRVPRLGAEVFDPVTGRVAPAVVAPDDLSRPIVVAESRPADGAIDVAEDAHLALRFSGPIGIDGTIAGAIVLTGPNGDVPVRGVVAEGGRLLFVWPQAPLASDSDYVLRLPALAAEQGRPVAVAPIAFKTRRDPRATPRSPRDDEAWVPDADSLQNGWRSGRPDSPWQQLPARLAPEGITALAGQVLRLDGLPLAGVTLAVGSQQTETDRTGRFLLPLPDETTGRVEMLIDGRTANRPRRTYGLFEVGVAVRAGRTTVLPYTVWMPLLDTAHAVRIPSPTTGEVVVTTPRIPGLELHLPAGTVIRDEEEAVVRELTITAIPLDRPPFALPSIDVPVYFTIQPGGAYVHTYGSGTKGAWLVYPNGSKGWAGKRIPFFHYDPEEKDWYVYGVGTVTPNRAQVVPDASTRLYEFTGAMLNMGWGPPADAAPPGDECCNDGDPVNLWTGLFELEQTDLTLPDVLPLALTRTYRTRDLDVRPFGIGTTHPYGMFLWSALQYQEADLILPDGGRIHYVRTSPGTGFTDAVFEHKETATTSATPTGFYKSTLTWNGAGWDLRMKDGLVYVFGENAPLQAIRDRYGNTIRLTWSLTNASGSGYGNLLQVTSPHGRWIQFAYDGSNRIIEAKDPIGRTVGYTYDAQGRLWKVTDPLTQVTEYTYDSGHRLLTVKNRNGVVVVTNEYTTGADAPTPVGWVKKQTSADGGTYQFTYTVVNGKSTQTDITNPRGFERRVTFNSSGYTLVDTRGLGTPEQVVSTSTRPTSANFVTNITGALGHQTSQTYDSTGNLITIIRQPGTPEALTTTITYDPTFHQLASLTDDLSHTTSLVRNASGSLTSITDALNHQTTFAYNAAGQVISTTDALQNSTVFEYQSGDLIKTTSPLNQVTSRVVDAVGRLVRVTDPMGQATRYEYDALDRVTKIIDPAGGETRLTYLPEGQTLSVTDANDHVVDYDYDNMGRRVSRIDPLQRAETITYDLNGNLSEHTDRKGQITTTTYDPLDRVKVLTSSSGATVTYTYDAANRVTEVADSSAGTITRQYDSHDRLTSETTVQGTVSYGYDGADRRSEMTIAGQPTVTYTYDNADRLTGITRSGQGVTLGYDDANRRTSLTLSNGVITEYGYDVASQLTALTYKLGAVTLGTLTYAYDGSGNRAEVGGTFARTMLPMPVANVVHDAANQLVQWGTMTMSHDANGNRTSDGLTSFLWNTRNQLTGLAGATTASFQYDGSGRRVSKTTQGVSTTFLYDGIDAVQESTGGASTEWLRGMELDDAYQRSNSAGTRIPLVDAVGSTIALVDATGAVQSEFAYEPFGRTTASGAAHAYPSQYAGRDNDGTGLYFFRARYYDPATQRFVSQDPLSTSAGPQSYAYVSNNPVTWTDPLGLQHRKGGPKHLPEGVRIRCNPGDPCSLLLLKIAAFQALIVGHQAWDAVNQPGRHDTEIKEFQNGQNRCWDFYKRQKCDCKPQLPEPPPMTQEQINTQQQILQWIAMLGMAAAAAAYAVFVM